MEDNQFLKVVQMFNMAGYKGKMFEDESYMLTIGELRVAIFGYEWTNTNQRGHVLAEHEDNFDKWSKAFYWCDLPEDQEQFEAVLRDLKHIDNEADKNFGDEFGLLRRTF